MTVTAPAGLPYHDAAERRTEDDLQFWLALAAGEAAWADESEPVLPITRFAATLTLIGYLATAAVCWISFLLRDDASGFARAAPWAATAALGLLATRPLRLVTGNRRSVNLWASAVVRIVLMITVFASLMPNSPYSGWLSIWPFAIATGAESAMVAWETGLNVKPVRCWFAFVRSPLHLGVVGAAAAATLNLGFSETAQVVLPLYLTIHGSIIVGAITAALLDRLRTDTIELEDDLTRAAAAAEHRKSAHWLHDDVSSEIKLMQLKLQQQTIGVGQMAEELGHLDHKLRLRQLDELFDSGTVRVAEVIQPFVRSAQGHGTTITSVPTFDEAAHIIDPTVGRQLARASSVLINNAIVAGATELGFEVEACDDHVRLTIIDNAGGFSLDDVPAGRGLWQLDQEIGTGRISVDRIQHGSRVTVMIDRHPGSRP